MSLMKGRSTVITQPPAAAGRSRLSRQLLIFGKWIVEGEELPRDDDKPTTQRLRSSPLAWLASPGQLPNSPDSGLGRRGFVPWLTSRDHLPNPSEAPRSARGFLGWVTAREDLPKEPSEKIPAPRSFLRWLLFSEPLGRFESLQPNKKAPPHES